MEPSTLQRFEHLHIVSGYVPLVTGEACGAARRFHQARGADQEHRGPTMKTHRLYINGEFVEPVSSAQLEVINPATSEVLARVPDAGREDVGRAVRAARTAFDQGPWKETTAQERGRILLRLAGVVRDRADELAELETRNSGKPIVESEFDVADVATCFAYYCRV